MGEAGSWIKIELNGEKGYVRNRTKYVTLVKTIKPKTDPAKTSVKTTIVKDTKTEKTIPAPAPTVLDNKKSNLLRHYAFLQFDMWLRMPT